MKRNAIRLTESDLHRVIKESVKTILNEMDWRTLDNAAKTAEERFKSETNPYKKDKLYHQMVNLRQKAKEAHDKRFPDFHELTDKFQRNIAFNDNLSSLMNGYTGKEGEKYDKDKGTIEKINQNGRVNMEIGKDIDQKTPLTPSERKRLERDTKEHSAYFRGEQEYRNGKWRQKWTKDPDEIEKERLESLEAKQRKARETAEYVRMRDHQENLRKQQEKQEYEDGRNSRSIWQRIKDSVL
jgi:hypothetical protein